MQELKLKHRRGEITLTEKDIIMDNGACYQLITQKYTERFNNFPYELSKTVCKKLIKEGKLVVLSSDEVKSLQYYKLA